MNCSPVAEFAENLGTGGVVGKHCDGFGSVQLVKVTLAKNLSKLEFMGKRLRMSSGAWLRSAPFWYKMVSYDIRENFDLKKNMTIGYKRWSR